MLDVDAMRTSLHWESLRSSADDFEKNTQNILLPRLRSRKEFFIDRLTLRLLKSMPSAVPLDLQRTTVPIIEKANSSKSLRAALSSLTRLASFTNRSQHKSASSETRSENNASDDPLSINKDVVLEDQDMGTEHNEQIAKAYKDRRHIIALLLSAGMMSLRQPISRSSSAGKKSRTSSGTALIGKIQAALERRDQSAAATQPRLSS